MQRLSVGVAAVVLLAGCGDGGESDLFGPGTGGSGASSAGGTSGSNNGGSSSGGDANGGSDVGGQASGGSGASSGSAGTANGGSGSGGSASGGAGNSSSGGAGSGGGGNASSGGAAGSGSGGSAGNPSGGSAGAGGSTTGGTSAGGSSAGGVGGSGTGGTGGGGGVVCGAPPGIAHPALYTTLDDDAAILNPVYGNAVGAMYSGDGFRPSECQAAISMNGSDRFVAYRQTKDGYQNFEYEQGTVSFWYQPSYDYDDNKNHHLFASNDDARWNSAGGLRIRKAAANNGNEFQVFAVRQGPGPAVFKETTVTASNYGWKKGDWVHIEVTWDFRVTSSIGQNVHIYFDGVEATYDKASSGPLTFPTESEDARFYFGAWGNLDSETASGLIDEFMIWTSVVR